MNHALVGASNSSIASNFWLFFRSADSNFYSKRNLERGPGIVLRNIINAGFKG